MSSRVIGRDLHVAAACCRRIVMLALFLAIGACGSKPLPEADSPAAKTYVATCGGRNNFV